MKYVLNFIRNIKYLFIIDSSEENLFKSIRAKQTQAQIKAMQKRIDDIEHWAEFDLDAQISFRCINDLIMRLKESR